jgi:hypothetical protein
MFTYCKKYVITPSITQKATVNYVKAHNTYSMAAIAFGLNGQERYQR